MSYQIERFFRKWIPIALLGALLLGGYHYFTTSPRNRWKLPRTMSQSLRKVPYLGTYFKKKTSRVRHAKSYSKRRHKRAYRKGRRSKLGYAYKKRAKRSKKRYRKRGRRRR